MASRAGTRDEIGATRADQRARRPAARDTARRTRAASERSLAESAGLIA